MELKEGCQLCILLQGEKYSLFDYLMKNVVITDWRGPNVIGLLPFHGFF
jgi:kynureninase